MAQRPILVSDAQMQTDAVLAALKDFLSDKAIQESIRQARALGGWEGWLQVQFAFFLKHYLVKHDIAREGQVYNDTSKHVDLWCWPLENAPPPQAQQCYFIELKVQYMKSNDPSKPSPDNPGYRKPAKSTSLPERLKTDVIQFYDHIRTFKPQFTTPANAPQRGRVYCIGYTSDVFECTSGYDNLYRDYPGIQLYYWRQSLIAQAECPGTKLSTWSGGSMTFRLMSCTLADLVKSLSSVLLDEQTNSAPLTR